MAFNLSSRYCGNQVELEPVFFNLTASYDAAYQSDEAPMVFASIFMFVLAGVFFTNDLFSGVSDVSAILNPKVRLVLSSALSLLLPVMSYLYSEAKNGSIAAATATTTRYSASYSRSSAAGERNLRQKSFSQRAWLILVWMLLVELLRKKVDEIRWRGYSGTIQWAGRVVWLGSLVFSNVWGVGRKAVFAVLWVICAVKLLQRIVFTEVWKRSYVHAKNARLISSYMARMLEAAPDRRTGAAAAVGGDVDVDVDVEHAAAAESGNELLKRCSYILMGEEKLVKEATADGYELKEIAGSGSAVTVGEVWELAESDQLLSTLDRDHRLKRLCLSFALFKLLRRRFEHLAAMPMAESRHCRDLLFKGLYRSSSSSSSQAMASAAPEALFQVMNDEVTFLSEYYHSVVPVVLAGPFFFLVNYVLVPVVVLGLCLMVVVVSGNGDVVFAYHSIQRDNYALSYYSSPSWIMCFVLRAATVPSILLSMLDLSTTALLFVLFLYEEVWELLVFLLSDWFMVSLLCSYTAAAARSRRRGNGIPAAVRRSLRCVVWLRSKVSHGGLNFKQFSVLGLRWPLVLETTTTLSLMVRTVAVPTSVKRSTMEYLAAHVHGGSGGGPITNGSSALEKYGQLSRLSRACESESVAEVILTWHVATSLLEAKCPRQGRKSKVKVSGGGSSRAAATSRSKYCAYLVAFHPELLPDNPDKAEQVMEAMKEELKGKLGWWNYYFSRRRTRASKIMATASSTEWKDHKEVVHNGAKLGSLLEHESAKDGDRSLETVWKLLADVWTELVVYVALSKDGELVRGHENVLEQGGEFITVLWALITHTGVTRPDRKPPPADDHPPPGKLIASASICID